MFRLLNHYLHKVPSGRFYTFLSKRINKTNIGMIVSLHSVSNESDVARGSLNDFIEISADKLEKIIIDFKKMGVMFVTLQELENALENNNAFSKPVVHFSFDDGYRNNYLNAFPVLKKYGIPFSIFIVSDFMNNAEPFLWWYMAESIIRNKQVIEFGKYHFNITADMHNRTSPEALFIQLRDFLLENIDSDREYLEAIIRSKSRGFKMPETLSWNEMNEMIASGLCEAGVHTKTHARSSKLTEAETEYEIVTCREAIFANTGVQSKWFAYSYGSKEDIGNKNMLRRVMKKAGIEMALTTNCYELNMQSDRYFLPRIFLNNSTSIYTLKTRLNGSYQRSLAQEGISD